MRYQCFMNLKLVFIALRYTDGLIGAGGLSDIELERKVGFKPRTKT